MRSMSTEKNILLTLVGVTIICITIYLMIIKTQNQTMIVTNKPTLGTGGTDSGSIQSLNITHHQEKIILLWNGFYKNNRFDNFNGVGSFTRNNCKVGNCRLETDRRLLRKASVVIVHMRGRLEPFPPRINQQQLFVYLVREAPTNTDSRGKRYRDKFNLTMTYRMDSDVPIPISMMLRKSHTDPQARYQLKQSLSSRPHSVAWLVSHCVTSSKREMYAAALSKYIDVHIYGKCGAFKCPKGNSNCMQEIEKNYKFYLGFENSVCDGYITEKYYRTTRYELIPIVYGGVDYAKIVPQKSFINILDYPSPRHLADYLKYLSSNQTAYEEYFQWKPHWTMINNGQLLNNGLCKLCALANDQRVHKIYKDTHRWWTKGTCHHNTMSKLLESTKRKE